MRLLNPLTHRMVNAIAEEKAQEVVSAYKTANLDVMLNVKETERHLLRYDMEEQHLLKAKEYAKAGQLIDEAKKTIEVAREIAPDDPEVLINVAKGDVPVVVEN